MLFDQGRILQQYPAAFQAEKIDLPDGAHLCDAREALFMMFKYTNLHTEYIQRGRVKAITKKELMRWATRNDRIRNMDIAAKGKYRPTIGGVWMNWGLPPLLRLIYAESHAFGTIEESLESMTMGELLECVHCTAEAYVDHGIIAPEAFIESRKKLMGLVEYLDPDGRFCRTYPMPETERSVLKAPTSELVATAKRNRPGTVILFILLAFIIIILEYIAIHNPRFSPYAYSE